MPDFDVIVLGAGAAGMMAGIEAGKRGRKVLVVDHARDPGEKIRISGGGRCNFTNVNATHTLGRERFLSQNPRFALSALEVDSLRSLAGVSCLASRGLVLRDAFQRELDAFFRSPGTALRAWVTLWPALFLEGFLRAREE